MGKYLAVGSLSLVCDSFLGHSGWRYELGVDQIRDRSPVSRNPRKARRVTRAAVIGACTALLGLVAVVPAHADDPVNDNNPDRQYFGFVAPVAGQSVLYQSKAALNPDWNRLCLRWRSGVNTGQPVSTRDGLLMWNSYVRGWTAPGISGKPFRQWAMKATLYSGSECNGQQIGEEKVPPAPRPADTGNPDNVYWIDFR